ncbi:MAG: hypothetical protein ACI8P0_001872 [Planctomycetaceae bacterium]|jgi:hypothetical protein
MKSFGKSVVQFFFRVGLFCTFYVGKYVLTVQTEQPPPRVRTTTRVIPMAVTTLKPGMVTRSGDIGAGPWPADEIAGDVLLSDKYIVGRVVKDRSRNNFPIRTTNDSFQSFPRRREPSESHSGLKKLGARLRGHDVVGNRELDSCPFLRMKSRRLHPFIRRRCTASANTQKSMSGCRN